MPRQRALAVDRIMAYVRESTDATIGQVNQQTGEQLILAGHFTQIIRADIIGAWVVAASSVSQPCLASPNKIAISFEPAARIPISDPETFQWITDK